MTRDEAKKRIKDNSEIYFNQYGIAGNKKGYVCPICQNGTGRDGTGLETKDNIHYKCFKCDTYGDVLDFIAKENGLDIERDFKEILEKACSIYGINDIDSASIKKIYT